jgi:hypothetical protein
VFNLQNYGALTTKKSHRRQVLPKTGERTNWIVASKMQRKAEDRCPRRQSGASTNPTNPFRQARGGKNSAERRNLPKIAINAQLGRTIPCSFSTSTKKLPVLRRVDALASTYTRNTCGGRDLSTNTQSCGAARGFCESELQEAKSVTALSPKSHRDRAVVSRTDRIRVESGNTASARSPHFAASVPPRRTPLGRGSPS